MPGGVGGGEGNNPAYPIEPSATSNQPNNYSNDGSMNARGRFTMITRLGSIALLAVWMFAQTQTEAKAIWVSQQVHKNGEYMDRIVQINSKAVEGGMREFEVVIRPTEKGKIISPFISAEAAIIQNDKWVAKVPMSERRYKDRIVYSFKVTPEAITGSKVEINESAFAPRASDKDLKVAPARDSNFREHMLGGVQYWFWLRDVAKEETPASTK
jgi:hypothetical protein